MTSNNKGPILEPGLCRCCGNMKKCRLINVEYEFEGKKEVYSDMFVDTFGLLLCQLDGEPRERAICATCVCALRHAAAFRGQVLRCEERLLQARLELDHDKQMKLELEVKHESGGSDGEAHADVADAAPASDTDNSDDKPLKRKPAKRKAKKAKRSRRADADDKQEMLASLRSMRQQLRSAQNAEPKPARDNEQKIFQNKLTLIENSFACPFDTSFSDYYCVYCRAMFTNPDRLREHTLEHDPTTFKDSFNHKRILQLDVMRVDCRLCSEPIPTIDAFVEHATSVHGKQYYRDVVDNFLQFKLTTSLSCMECGAQFMFFHALKRHMAEHFGTCVCDVCGIHYFNEHLLARHKKVHEKVEELYPCEQCGKTFKSRNYMLLHAARTHRRSPAYECPRCDAVLLTDRRRYRHMIAAHGQERRFPCESCPRVYDSIRSLREHNRKNHLKILKHQCSLCERRFYLPSELREHMTTHTGERNFRCEFCGKSYLRLRALRLHAQSHADKRYRCTLCGAAYTQNNNLKNHMKKHHHVYDDVDEPKLVGC